MKNQKKKQSSPFSKSKLKGYEKIDKKQQVKYFSSEDQYIQGNDCKKDDQSYETATNNKYVSHEPSTHADKESWRNKQYGIKQRKMEQADKKTKNDLKRKTNRNQEKPSTNKAIVNCTETHKKKSKNKGKESKDKNKQKKNKKGQNILKKVQSSNLQSQMSVNIAFNNRQERKYYQSKNEKQENGIEKKLIIDLRKKNKLKELNTKTTMRIDPGSKNKLATQIREMPSFRQYCVIKGKFIPLESTTERKQLQNIFSETACTNLDQTYSKYRYHNFHGVQKQGQQTERKAQKEDHYKAGKYIEVGIQTIKAQLAHYEVLVKAAQQEIGVQYSDRLNSLSSRKHIQILKQLKQNNQKEFQVCLNKTNAALVQKSDRSVLLEAMMRLESLELDENTVFQNLNLEQKRHFRQIFSSYLLRMKSPRIQCPPNFSRNPQSSNEIQFLKSEKKSNENTVPNPNEQKRQEMQQLIMMRESRQNNQFNVVIRSPQQVDTSMLAVISCFTNIFCYVQMNCEDSLLHTMNGLYGLSYNDKYRCISRFYSQRQKALEFPFSQDSEIISIASRIKLEITKRQSVLKALPDSLFTKFMEQLAEEDDNEDQQRSKVQKLNTQFLLNKCKSSTQKVKKEQKSYFWMHSKAVFDCINELLIPYRPFFPTKGDPFPWTMSPLKCLTFYSIDSDSLDTVIEQMQQKMSAYIKCLCGIHIDQSVYLPGDYRAKEEEGADFHKDIVFSMRRDKLTKSIIQDLELDTNEDPYLQMEIQNTCVMQELSLMITKDLLQQFLKEKMKF